MAEPLISMVVIAKDEAANIDRCFSSFWDDVDEVVICDTGSADGTLKAARAFAKKRGESLKLKTAHFQWTDDFSEARNFADSLATGMWVAWADLDDEVTGLGTLRQMAAEASPDLMAFFCYYDYVRDPNGNCLSELWRERLVRREPFRWKDPLHEHKLITGGSIVQVDRRQVQWLHHRSIDEKTSSERNLRILKKWDEREPGNARVLSSIGQEYMGTEKHAEAEAILRRVLECEGEPADRRAQTYRHLCMALLMQNKAGEAREAAFAALHEKWDWAETHLSLAESSHTLGDAKGGYEHAKTALEMGKPTTLLIMNPLQFSAHPRALMAICAAQMGSFEDAVRHGEEVLQIAPTYSLTAPHMPLWRGHIVRSQCVGAFVNTCELLMEHGELRKAESLLDSVPYFAWDEPLVINQRVKVAQAITQTVEAERPEIEDEAARKFVERQLEELAA